jgi:hypothetical protein
VPAGVVSWWAGEGNANDRIGANNGVLEGGVTFVPGEVGRAFDFDGTTADVKFPASPSLDVGPGAGLTIEAWIMPSDLLQMRPIVEWNSGDTSVAYPDGVHFWTSVLTAIGTGPGCLFANIMDTSSTSHSLASAPGLLTTTAFQHVAVTYSRTTGVAVLYINGAVVAQQDLGIFTPKTTSDLYLGYRLAGYPAGARFAGKMDEVTLYSRALSATEILSIYSAGTSGKCTTSTTAECAHVPAGLVGWWAGEGNANDSTGVNNGALEGGVTFVPGEVGLALSFDGTTADVVVPASPSLDVGAGEGFAIEAWIRPADLTEGRPIVEWNSGNSVSSLPPYGVHFWASQPPPPGNGAGCLFANLQDSTGGYHWIASPAGLLTTTAFQHVALTYSKTTGSAVIYLNGAAVAQEDVGTFTPETTSDLYLGYRPAGAPVGARFAGNMDEVSLYNRALSASEVLAIYNAGSSGKCALPPVIAVQPENQTASVGETAYFSVGTGGGSPPLSYQWQLNGRNVPYATGSLLVLTHVQLADAGVYSVIVSNAGGTVTSSNAVLTLNLTPGCVAPPAGLVGWWRAEDNANDSAGANQSIPQGGLAYVPGEVGQAFSFNGTDADVHIPASATLDVGAGSGLSVEAWINPADVIAQHPLVEWNGGSFGAQLWLAVIPPLGPGAGALVGDLVDTSRQVHAIASAGDLVVTNVWQHVAMTYDKTTGIAVLYLNGAVVQQQTLGVFTPLTTTDLWLGLRPYDGGAGLRYAGLMDEVSVYNRALSASEVLAIYNAGKAGKCVVPIAPFIVSEPSSQAVSAGTNLTFTVAAGGTPPLSFQWTFDGTNIASGTNASLTLTNVQSGQAGNYAVAVTNAAGSVTSSNAVLTVNSVSPCVAAPSGMVGWWRAEGNANDSAGANSGVLEGNVTFAPGLVGQAFDFDGVASYVAVPDAPALRLTNALSIEFWVKRQRLDHVELIIEKGGDWTGGQCNYEVALHDSFGNYCLYLLYNGGLQGGGQIADYNWHHCAVTATNGTSNVGIYIDGVRQPITFTTGSLTVNLYPSDRALHIGAQLDPYSGWYYYSKTYVDELAVYDRGLTPAEIEGIYNAGNAGKCGLAPVISSQPQSQTAAPGTAVTFGVTASGAAPLSYQWLFDSNHIAGATGSSLVLTNVQFTNAGAYSVIVSNSFGTVTSSTAVLTVAPSPALVQASNSSGVGSRAVTVPILLVAKGDENALAFTLDFDPKVLAYASVVPGSGATNAALVSNAGQATNGFLSVGVALPADAVFTAGTQEVAAVTFTIAIVTNAASTTVGFGNQVTRCAVVDVNATPLPANFAAGLVTIAPTPFEGDVWPRPNGDEAITVSDWVLEGRYVAGLDYPTNASEFQRADCAPRATLGDGAITIIDWVQVGRYMAGLDPLTPAGGPTSPTPVPGGMAAQKGAPSGLAKSDQARQVQVLGAVLLRGQPGAVSVNLSAQGNENALGFSLSFDPTGLTYTGASAGSSLKTAGATFMVNDTQAASGRLGFTLALQPGSSFTPGNQQLAIVNFSAGSAVSGNYPVALVSQPVTAQVSDPTASALAAGYINGTVLVSSGPTLSVACSDRSIVLSWPLWATNFVLQQASGNLSSTANWSSLAVTPAATAAANMVTLPLSTTNMFYRLRQQ